MNKLIKFGEYLKCSEYGSLGILITPSKAPYTYSLAFADMLVASGVDMLFFPFGVSDVRMPWSMGGTEQLTDAAGMKSGISAENFFEMMKLICEKYPDHPKVAVSFYSDILAYGIDRFIEKCVECGIDGIDLPHYSVVSSDDYSHFAAKLARAGICLIVPYSTEIAMSPKGTRDYDLLCGMMKASGGFGFLMADSTAKSGQTWGLPVDKMKPAAERLKAIQKELGIDWPLISVCGISTPQNGIEAVREIGTDGVLIASAVIRMILAEKPLEEIGAYLKTMKASLKR
ncbi:MAG: tryptophan synthase subunit alpha [Clostridia bacterium]|nr:tryptophan synthase subunit alpha [Clostridia bacterium]